MDIKKHGNIIIVHMPVRFDAHSSREVEKFLQEVIEHGSKAVLCNFKQTEYISSAGLRVLLSTMKLLRKSEGNFCLCSPSSFVQEVLETSGLASILKIFITEREALDNMS
jgi:anti-sigma B factor antagonist